MPDPPDQPPQRRHALRVRTVTAFVHLPADRARWEPEVAAAGGLLQRARARLEALGYEVQTTRLATQPFGDGWLGGGAVQLVAGAVELERLAAAHGVELVALGWSSEPAHLAAIPELLAATRATSCTFALHGDADTGLALQVARAAMRIAAATGGLGCFRFGSSSNMQPGVPYFPVAACGPSQARSFAIGTESDALLAAAFAAAGAEAAGAPAGNVHTLGAARRCLHDAMLSALAPLEAAALGIEADEAAAAAAAAAAAGGGAQAAGQGFRYLGIDSSLAPGLDTPALTDAYAALGCGAFGAAGSLSISAAITSVLKSLPLRLTGYCGLMLAVCEDQGLARAAQQGAITISQLLQYSAVCGCGLDTVPVPGPASASGSEAADAAATAAIARLMLDVNALAFRLGKPLACRLLPLPRLAPGADTGFDHPYMINSAVMDPDR